MDTDITFVYHLGAPQTDNDQIIWSIRKDSELMAEHGTLMPRPKGYRLHISNMIAELDGEIPSVVDQETLLGALIKRQKVSRLLLSDSKYMADPSWIFINGVFYDNAERNTAILRNLFPENPTEFFLGIANPASFIPAVFKAQNNKSYENFIAGTDLATIRWSDVISRIQQANPDCPITVWCNEDTPVIWPRVLRNFAGLDSKIRLQGELDIINGIISEEGKRLLVKYLDDRPKLTEIQREQVRAVFLEKFFLHHAVEEEIDLPGWTEETVEALTAIYEDDIKRIAEMPEVTFLAPKREPDAGEPKDKD